MPAWTWPSLSYPAGSPLEQQRTLSLRRPPCLPPHTIAPLRHGLFFHQMLAPMPPIVVRVVSDGAVLRPAVRLAALNVGHCRERHTTLRPLHRSRPYGPPPELQWIDRRPQGVSLCSSCR